MSEITPELVVRATAGAGAAVTEIVRALERPFYNVALRMLSDRQDAEDAAQEALIRVVTHLAQYRGNEQFSTWALRIAIRRILEVRTGRAPRIRFDEFATDLANGLDATAVERPEEAVLHRELKVLCSRALLQCLDPDHRVAFVLGEILELASSEAAEIVEVDPATFRKRLSRARAAPGEFLMRHSAATWSRGARRTCPNLEVAPLGPGLHFLQEDHPHAIGRRLADWIRRAR